MGIIYLLQAERPLAVKRRGNKQQKGGFAMLRGVNKKIIEVVDTQNEYFERAILFVKDGKLENDEGDIKRNADEFLKSAGARKLGRVLTGRRLVGFIKLLCAAGAGSLLTLLVMTL